MDHLDLYLRNHWPVGVPQDCQKLTGDLDCIETGLPRKVWCKSCKVYDHLRTTFDNFIGRPRRVNRAAKIRNKNIRQQRKLKRENGQ